MPRSSYSCRVPYRFPACHLVAIQGNGDMKTRVGCRIPSLVALMVTRGMRQRNDDARIGQFNANYDTRRSPNKGRSDCRRHSKQRLNLCGDGCKYSRVQSQRWSHKCPDRRGNVARLRIISCISLGNNDQLIYLLQHNLITSRSSMHVSIRSMAILAITHGTVIYPWAHIFRSDDCHA